MTRIPLRPNVIQTWAQKFDYCKMAKNVLTDISENMPSESENSEVSKAVDDDPLIGEFYFMFTFNRFTLAHCHSFFTHLLPFYNN